MDAQQRDEMTEGSKDKFFLQYYFPPSSVGETGRVGAPGRREVGHGQLAQRALTPIIPDEVSLHPARPILPANTLVDTPRCIVIFVYFFDPYPPSESIPVGTC